MIFQEQEALLKAPSDLLVRIGYEKRCGVEVGFIIFSLPETQYKYYEHWINFVHVVLQGFFEICDETLTGYPFQEFSHRVLNVFGESLLNAAEHGNKFNGQKQVLVGFWLADGGVLIGIKDEGDFFRRKEVKEKIEARVPFKSTRELDPSGLGLEEIYDLVSDIRVLDSTLFLAVLREDIHDLHS